jgi:hypothetical protein
MAQLAATQLKAVVTAIRAKSDDFVNLHDGMVTPLDRTCNLLTHLPLNKECSEFTFLLDMTLQASSTHCHVHALFIHLVKHCCTTLVTPF